MKPLTKTQFLAIPEKERLSRVLEGLMWYPSVHAPNMSSVKKFAGEPYFIVNLVLDEANQKKALAYGLKINPPEGKIPGPYVKIKRKVKAGKTAAEVAPDVVDSMQNEIPPTILIGNNSRGRCKFATYWYDTGAGGIGAALYKVQVLDLVPYVPNAGDMPSDPKGFVVGAAQTAQSADEHDGLEDDIPFDTSKFGS